MLSSKIKLSKATTFLQRYQLPKIGSFLILSELDPENKRFFLIISVFFGYFSHHFPKCEIIYAFIFLGLGLNSGYGKMKRKMKIEFLNAKSKLVFWNSSSGRGKVQEASQHMFD